MRGSKISSQLNKVRDLVLLWLLPFVASTFLLGTLAAVLFPGLDKFLILWLIIAVLSGLFLVIRRNLILLLPAVFCLGIFWTAAAAVALDSFPVAADRVVDLSGQVVEVVEQRSDYLSNLTAESDLTADGSTFVIETACENWQGKVMVFAADYEIELGDRITLSAQVKENSQLQNWYVQDWENYLRNQGIGAYVQVLPGCLKFTELADLNLLQQAGQQDQDQYICGFG